MLPTLTPPFERAAWQIFKVKLFSNPEAPLSYLEQVVNLLNTLRKQALDERKQLHAEKSKSR
jgi:hypothetical protein